MKQPLHVKLIREFIEEKNGRPFEEVKAYADSIGASEESLEEAVFEVSEESIEFVPSQHSLGKFKKNKTYEEVSKIYKKIIEKKRIVGPIAVAAIVVLFLFINFSELRGQRVDKTSKALASKNGNTVKNVENQFFGIGQVYASQNEIDANKVFSFPSSGVTLKYSGTPKKDVLGFFPYWMMPTFDKINLTGVTEVAIFGLTSDGKGNVVIQNQDGSVDLGFEMWKDKKLDEFLVKTRRLGIKTLLTIKVFNNTDIKSISLSDENQKQLIANALELVKIKSLDGIVLDFEYVGSTTQEVTDGFTRFVANMNSELKRENEKAKLYVATYLIAAISPGFADIRALGINSDKLVVMGYDVHTPNGGPGPVAPMYGGNDIVGSIEGYLSKVDKEKVMLAVPYYGYTWVVDSEDKSSNGGVAYAEIQSESKKSQIQWDETAQSPYYYYNDEATGARRILYFDNARSLGIKYDYIKQKDLGGIAIWALGYDGLNEELGQLILEKFAQ